MRFHYIATKANGRTVENDVEARSSDEVLAFLSAKGLTPVSITKARKKGLASRQIYIGKAINATDKIFLAKHLALMLKVGTDLFRALDILITDTEKAPLRSLLKEIRSTLEKGQPFYVTFARYPKYFSPVFVNLVKAGEASGSLDTAFDNLSDILAEQEDLKRKIRAALIYPVLLLIGSFLIMTFLVTFALPKIAEVFMQGGMEVPTFSRTVFAIGLFLGDYVILIFGSFFILIIFLFYFFTRTVTGKHTLMNILGRVPVIGKVIDKIAIQRFSGTLSSLLKAGVPIVNALEITATSINHQKMSAALVRVAQEGLSKGLSIGDSFKRETVFPASVTSLITISEQSGSLDEVLATLSTFYDSEIESAIKTMVAFIEPALLILIGFVVALIALSIIVPVYQLVGQF
jgi:type IV pilus assembly protein PilC